MRHVLHTLVLFLLVSRSTTAQDAPSFALRGRQLCELALARHVDPPTLSQLLASGMREIYGSIPERSTLGIAREVSGVGTADELQRYLGEIRPGLAGGDDKLAETFRVGVMRVLPGGAEYLPDYEFRARVQIEGNRYVGVGISLHLDDERKVPAINGVFPGGPAQKGGLRVGDRVFAVDGVSTEGMGLQKFLEYSRAEEGSRLAYTVRHPDDDEKREIVMTRAVIPRETVVGLRRRDDDSWVHRLDRKVAYIKLTQIVASTPHELRRLAPRLEAEGFRALVIDLRRGGPSGDVRHAALVADAFLSEGEIGRVRRVKGERVFRCTPDRLFEGWPIAIIVGDRVRGSAEWLVAALQRSGRAQVVGPRTAGFPWEKSLVELGDGGDGLRFSTGRLVPYGGGNPRVEPDHLPPAVKGDEGKTGGVLAVARRVVKESLDAKWKL